LAHHPDKAKEKDDYQRKRSELRFLIVNQDKEILMDDLDRKLAYDEEGIVLDHEFDAWKGKRRGKGKRRERERNRSQGHYRSHPDDSKRHDLSRSHSRSKSKSPDDRDRRNGSYGKRDGSKKRDRSRDYGYSESKGEGKSREGGRRINSSRDRSHGHRDSERGAMIRTTEGVERVAGETARVVVETRGVVGTRDRTSTPGNYKLALNAY
jgi:hypothetical protein